MSRVVAHAYDGRMSSPDPGRRVVTSSATKPSRLDRFAAWLQRATDWTGATKPTRLDRFAAWIERATEPDFNLDRALIAAEGALIDDPAISFVMRGSRWYGIQIFTGEGRLIVTRERVRIYNFGLNAIVNVGLSDILDGTVVCQWLAHGKVQMRIPHDVGDGKHWMHLNRTVTITSSHADEVRQLLLRRQGDAWSNARDG